MRRRRFGKLRFVPPQFYLAHPSSPPRSPHHTMSLLTSILGFSAFGFGARCLQLGIQKRPIFEGFHGHAYAVIAFGMIGAGAYHLDNKQTELLTKKKKAMLEQREKENREWAARKGEAHAV
ncbi:hypothetical protein I307_06429 [Cryptococcus deuterogattii 99/473]|uniref:Uncharacterized protein n=1 Tax=Cryptococcus deuterogattii Ram5 TaxID=1296110 RepID=A0A0D0TBX5_9TREE|nr:hypothetical protein I309_06350 [Cryptococcus deuterogattii LA55]KIR37097.1 hypothetical protein I352_00409 [Cryptococcus deuterogattii MMRL2647]KIR43567.1 hypothetical protein I313_00409 [Cryptococcus deuterogattii Ram5]KIR74901.1 hypothetical protein I310_01175 [Cryptococcus deuterogattii CA1014]KIR92173.1 hypothetical protein I304_03577 [Cryptococcus deuterogattii CBS 10090]KIS01339.1 hypothetical protein L804_01217 [Cryptococcus deuterogattii 2001/935-1]KIY54254.1 hypothetical protein 